MGLASAEEQRDVEGWIKQYPEVADEVRSIEAGLETYAKINAVQPGESVKEKVFSAINKTASTQDSAAIVKEPSAQGKIRSISPAWKWVAAASILLLVASIATNVVYYNKYDTANKDVAQAQHLLAEQQQKNEEMKTDMRYVHDPNSMPVALKGMAPMPDATAKIFWMQNNGDVMIDASNLPDAPAGMQYQFWAIVDGTPVDGGMIITNDKGKKFRMQKMRSFGKAEAFAISLEKEGGTTKPTEVVSMGKII